MAEYTQSSTCYAHVINGGDSVDLGADFYRVSVNGPGGDISIAPGEAASLAGGEARLYGVVNVPAATWEIVSPEFPCRYLLFATGGTWTIHRAETAGRRASRN